MEDYGSGYMGEDGVRGTDIELLAMATMLQIPLYTFTKHQSRSNVYHWIKFTPFHPSQFSCSYSSALCSLVKMNKPLKCHLELLHLNGNHYDLIITSTDSPSPELSLSGSFVVETIFDS